MSAGVISDHYAGVSSLYPASVLADAPVIYLKLDEAASATTAVDSSGSGHDGTYSPGITSGATSLLSDGSGKAATFAFHTSTGINVPTGTFLNVSALSIEALVTFSSSPDITSGDGIVSRYGAGGTSWLLWRNTAGKLAFQIITSGSGTVNVTGTTTPTLGTRYGICATWDGTTAKLYVNNSLEASAGATGTLGASTEDFRVAAYSAGASTVPGMTIDEVAFYNTALSSTRISAHYALA